MHRPKNSYHPLFVILFTLDLLPHEVVQQIPRATRNEWLKRNLENSFGFQFCAMYIKHFNDVSYAHKYSFTRYVLSTAIEIQKTMLTITQDTALYKKILRMQAYNIIGHISTLAHKGFSVSKACKLFGVKTSWYHYHKHRINCPLNVLKLCFRRHPNQLTQAEQHNIKKWIQQKENAGKNLTQLYYGALHENIVACSKKTFNFYAKQYGYQKAPRKPAAKRKKGHRANHVFEYLHADTTYIPTVFDGMLKLTMIKDSFSKAPLHFAITKTNVSSHFIKQVVEGAFDKYRLFDRTHDINIVTDGGAENKGEVLHWIGTIKAPPCVRKITAKTEQYPYSNNMIEGTFHLLKHDFLKGEIVTDQKKLTEKVEAFIAHCHNRYFGELHGITPLQVINGAVPDKNLFKMQIQQAVARRRLDNKNFYGCLVPGCD